ncbi:MAG: hypothetical protein BWX92_02353 [Deltaproteobacteria bacterium ADurb.Bin135]|nr:MAG: hypothetical protein BWX92_02353 [Deltaproteobacteria bacterium ADurb.Bin135]
MEKDIYQNDKYAAFDLNQMFIQSFIESIRGIASYPMILLINNSMRLWSALSISKDWVFYHLTKDTYLDIESRD